MKIEVTSSFVIIHLLKVPSGNNKMKKQQKTNQVSSIAMHRICKVNVGKGVAILDYTQCRVKLFHYIALSSKVNPGMV